MDDLEPQDNWEKRARYWHSIAEKRKEKADLWDVLTSESRYAPVVKLITEIDEGKAEAAAPKQQSGQTDAEYEEMKAFYKAQKAEREAKYEAEKRAWFAEVNRKESEWSAKRPDLAQKGFFGAQGKVNAALAEHRFQSWDDALDYVAYREKINLSENGSSEPQASEPDTKPTESAGATAPVGGKAPSKASREPRSWQEAVEMDRQEHAKEFGR